MVSLRLVAAFVVCGFLAECVSAQGAYPPESPAAYAPPSYPAPSAAPPAYKAPAYKPSYANGRVKIQAYRGPSKDYGSGKGYKESFAPWGFYVSQPEDIKPYYGKPTY